MSSWGEKGINFLKEISELNGNVKTLQDQMGRALDQIEKSRDEIRDLKADLRVLEKEIQVKSMETVVNAHAQIIERVLRLEASMENERLANGSTNTTSRVPIDRKKQDTQQ